MSFVLAVETVKSDILTLIVSLITQYEAFCFMILSLHTSLKLRFEFKVNLNNDRLKKIFIMNFS